MSLSTHRPAKRRASLFACSLGLTNISANVTNTLQLVRGPLFSASVKMALAATLLLPICHRAENTYADVFERAHTPGDAVAASTGHRRQTRHSIEGGAARESERCSRGRRLTACLGLQLQRAVVYSAGALYCAYARANSRVSVCFSLLTNHLPAVHVHTRAIVHRHPLCRHQ